MLLNESNTLPLVLGAMEKGSGSGDGSKLLASRFFAIDVDVLVATRVFVVGGAEHVLGQMGRTRETARFVEESSSYE